MMGKLVERGICRVLSLNYVGIELWGPQQGVEPCDLVLCMEVSLSNTAIICLSELPREAYEMGGLSLKRFECL